MREPGHTVDAAPACPFVAFEDDRDARATAPDHRHRCYAEPRPAPRALAHQEAYCLSSAFAVCPTFQDWARREAAAARPGVGTPAAPVRQEAEPVAERATLPPPDREATHPPAGALPPHRPAPRDWAAPPPWLNPETASRDRRDRDGDPPPFLADRPPRPDVEPGRGLAGSAADRVASEHLGSSATTERSTPLDHRREAARPGAAPEPHDWATRDAMPASERASGDDPWVADPAPQRIERRDRVPAERPDYQPAAPTRRPVTDGHRDESQAMRGPSWERPRRFEAYPTLKTRMSLPSLPGSSILIGFAALVLAAVALFFLPALLGVGDDEPSATPTPSAVAERTPSPEPTPVPEPTPTVHVVAEGDTLSSIAAQFGLTLEELVAANPQITDPDRIAPGDEVIIPAAEASAPSEIGGGEEASPAP